MTSKTSFPRDKIKILLLEGINKTAVDVFRKAGYKNVVVYNKALDADALRAELADTHLLGIRSKTQLTEGVLDKAGKLLGVGCFCIGTNQVSLSAATARGVAVFNSPYSNTRSVAELVVANAILLLRRVYEKSVAAHSGKWLKDHRGCHEIRGKTIGIIGYGHIGSQVSVMAESLGMHVLYHDIESKLALGNAQAAHSLEALLTKSDIVTLHVPGGKSTRNLMDKKRIGQIKKGAVLLNLSRGDVVDIDAAAAALRAGLLGGMAADVFPAEPAAAGETFSSPLQGLANVILTPHIGGSTEEAQQNIGLDAAGKLVSFLESGQSTGSLTVPSLSLPVQQGAHRLLHIHRNVPGVLSEINSAISRHKMNILGQYLKTNEQIGYVVLDVERKASPRALAELRKVKHTIKVRTLY